MTSFPALDDLIWLFESEPDFLFVDEGWPLSAATWRTIRGDTEVVCTIVPFENTVQVTVSTGGGTVAEVYLRQVVDVITVDRAHGAEALVARCLDGAHLEPTRLQLKPHVSISTTTRPPWSPA